MLVDSEVLEDLEVVLELFLVWDVGGTLEVLGFLFFH